jgi:hypothetical protein
MYHKIPHMVAVQARKSGSVCPVISVISKRRKSATTQQAVQSVCAMNITIFLMGWGERHYFLS